MMATSTPSSASSPSAPSAAASNYGSGSGSSHEGRPILDALAADDLESYLMGRCQTSLEAAAALMEALQRAARDAAAAGLHHGSLSATGMSATLSVHESLDKDFLRAYHDMQEGFDAAVAVLTMYRHTLLGETMNDPDVRDALLLLASDAGVQPPVPVRESARPRSAEAAAAAAGMPPSSPPPLSLSLSSSSSSHP